jgi:hypothetical protein
MVLGGGATPLVGLMEPDPNDITNNVSLANVQSAAQTVVTNIMANAHPPTKLLFLGLMPGTYGNSGACNGLSTAACYAAYTSAEAAGVTAAANANTTFVHTQQLASGAPDWFSAATNTNCAASPGTGTGGTIDGTHPCPSTAVGQLGYGQIANRLAPVLLAATGTASFTISGGASSGNQYTPSTAFTVTLGGAGTTWVDVVKISSTVASDTICIVSSVCGQGSVTLPASWGTQTFSFTVRPITTGARTISYGSLADGWLAPSSNSYTSTSVITGTRRPF